MKCCVGCASASQTSFSCQGFNLNLWEPQTGWRCQGEGACVRLLDLEIVWKWCFDEGHHLSLYQHIETKWDWFMMFSSELLFLKLRAVSIRGPLIRDFWGRCRYKYVEQQNSDFPYVGWHYTISAEMWLSNTCDKFKQTLFQTSVPYPEDLTLRLVVIK